MREINKRKAADEATGVFKPVREYEQPQNKAL